METTISTTMVYLNPQQIMLLKLLDIAKAFDIRNGSITINFDGSGKISSLDKKEHYKP